MFRLTAFVALMVLTAAHADNSPIVPKTAPPQFVTINEFDAGREQLTIGVVKTVAVTKTREVTANGQTRTETFVENVAVAQLEKKSTHAAKFWNSDGKTMDKASALQMLKRGTVILMTDSPTGIDPLYLKALAKDVVIMREEPAVP